MKIPKYDKAGNKLDNNLNLDPDWIATKDGLPNEAVVFADHFGRHLTAPYFNGERKQMEAGRDALTTSQLRNFFSEVRRIQTRKYENNKSDFYMLKPKLVYAQARVLSSKKYNRIKSFVEVLTILINKVIETDNPIHFKNFTKFLEATVAYHKSYGGK